MRTWVASLGMLVMVSLVTTSMQCPRKMARLNARKITFDYSAIDAQGLRNGEVAVDYEFCIPGHDSIWSAIKSIAPNANLMKKSKGRVGCSAAEWLCIVNTHDAQWKYKLQRIANLPYVDRISEVFYE
jgi:hypothetical protein